MNLLKVGRKDPRSPRGTIENSQIERSPDINLILKSRDLPKTKGHLHPEKMCAERAKENFLENKKNPAHPLTESGRVILGETARFLLGDLQERDKKGSFPAIEEGQIQRISPNIPVMKSHLPLVEEPNEMECLQKSVNVLHFGHTINPKGIQIQKELMHPGVSEVIADLAIVRKGLQANIAAEKMEPKEMPHLDFPKLGIKITRNQNLLDLMNEKLGNHVP